MSEIQSRERAKTLTLHLLCWITFLDISPFQRSSRLSSRCNYQTPAVWTQGRRPVARAFMTRKPSFNWHVSRLGMHLLLLSSNKHSQMHRLEAWLQHHHMQVLLLSCSHQCYWMISLISRSILKYSRCRLSFDLIRCNSLLKGYLIRLSSHGDIFKHVAEDIFLRWEWRRPTNSPSRLQNLSFVWASVYHFFLIHSFFFPAVSFLQKL